MAEDAASRSQRRARPRHARAGRTTLLRAVGGTLVALVPIALFSSEASPRRGQEEPVPVPTVEPSAPDPPPRRPRGEVVLGFAGDVHFEWHAAALLAGDPAEALGPVTALMRRLDVMVVNLESSLTLRGTPEPKEFTFRTSPRALDVLAASGVDVVTMANNHAVDFGRVGLVDTLRAVDRSRVPVVGIGRDVAEAFRPHRLRVGRTTVSVLGVSQRPDRTWAAWTATRDRPGIATSLRARPRLLAEVARADRRGELVVVYLHWGAERESCPTPAQQRMAAALSDAGADVVVGSHAHMLQGAGWLGDTYVAYGLGNFVWYNTHRPDSGILTVRVRDGEAVEHRFAPALIGDDGRPSPLRGPRARAALAAWDAVRGCAGLADRPPAD